MGLLGKLTIFFWCCTKSLEYLTRRCAKDLFAFSFLVGMQNIFVNLFLRCYCGSSSDWVGENWAEKTKSALYVDTTTLLYTAAEGWAWCSRAMDPRHWLTYLLSNGKKAIPQPTFWVEPGKAAKWEQLAEATCVFPLPLGRGRKPSSPWGGHASLSVYPSRSLNIPSKLPQTLKMFRQTHSTAKQCASI